MDLYWKQEFLQFTGCFKERGIRNTLLRMDAEERKRGVISATIGNHGMALSYITQQMGIQCTLVFPLSSSIRKISRCSNWGARIQVHGNTFLDAKKFALYIAKEKNIIFINGYDHPHIIEGHGTLGIEILEQVPTVDAVLVPVGGGGLLAGVATAIKHLNPEVEIYGVETERTGSMYESMKKNERTKIEDGSSSVADELAIPVIGSNAYHNIQGLVEKIVIVKEDYVARAIMHVVEQEKYVLEGAGAVTIAALFANLLPSLKEKKVVCLISGGNISTSMVSRVLERGMAAEGRIVKFKVRVNDKASGMADLYALLADIGVMLRESLPERAWVQSDIFSLELKVICETRGREHTQELIEQIQKNYTDYHFLEVGEKKERRLPCRAPNPICCLPTNPEQ